MLATSAVLAVLVGFGVLLGTHLLSSEKPKETTGIGADVKSVASGTKSSLDLDRKIVLSSFPQIEDLGKDYEVTFTQRHSGMVNLELVDQNVVLRVGFTTDRMNNKAKLAYDGCTLGSMIEAMERVKKLDQLQKRSEEQPRHYFLLTIYSVDVGQEGFLVSGGEFVDKGFKECLEQHIYEVAKDAEVITEIKGEI